MFADLGANIVLGLETAFSWTNLMYCIIGVSMGMLVGVLPGIGSLAAISMLLPITFHLEPTAAIVMLAGVFYGSSYGGSTASILLNLPGSPSGAVACIDGYPMSKQGRGGVALLMTTVGSFVGGSIGIIIMMLGSPIIVEYALKFGPAEYFSLMVLGLIAASAITTGSPIKGVAMVVAGLLLGCVGSDLETGVARFAFDIPELYDGINLGVVAMGIFGLSEVIASISAVKSAKLDAKAITFRSMLPTDDDLRRSTGPILRGTAVGSFFGILPGTGGVIASFMAYAVEKKVSKTPERFGHGAIEGVISPETANNAADQTAFIPTLTLGIPGNVIMALMIGALTIHGIVPGPQFMAQHPDMFWGLIMSFWIGNVVLVFLNIPMIGLWIRILAIPYHLLYPPILMFVAIGVYSVNNSHFDVIMVGLIGALGYTMRLLELPQAPLILGFVLGPLMEENLRRALLIGRGDFMVLINRPISGTIMVMSFALLAWAVYDNYKPNKNRIVEADG